MIKDNLCIIHLFTFVTNFQERQLRERSEEHYRQLQEERGSTQSQSLTIATDALKLELERLEVRYLIILMLNIFN